VRARRFLRHQTSVWNILTLVRQAGAINAIQELVGIDWHRSRDSRRPSSSFAIRSLLDRHREVIARAGGSQDR